MAGTITYLSRLVTDANGNVLPVAHASARLGCEDISGGGEFTAPTGTQFVRISTDTALSMNLHGTDGSGTPELFQPGVEFVGVIEGTVLDIGSV